MSKPIAATDRRAPKAAPTPPPTPAPIENATVEQQHEPLQKRRENRKPFGAHALKLAFEKRPGYHRHIFNDEPGRITRAQAAGYEHVIDPDTGEPWKRVVGVAPSGGGALMGYLMEIPQEWYDEDMKAQQDIVDDREKDIIRGAVAGEPGKDGRYIPSQGIKISRR